MMQVSEITPNSVLDNVLQLRDTAAAMKTVSFRATAQDYKIITKAAAKLGLKTSQVIKVALRRLAESENLKAS